jgi:hypothetical protein
VSLSKVAAATDYFYAVQNLADDTTSITGMVARSTDVDDVYAIASPPPGHITKEIWLNFPQETTSVNPYIEVGSRTGNMLLGQYACVNTCFFAEEDDPVTGDFSGFVSANSQSGSYEFELSIGPDPVAWNAQIAGMTIFNFTAYDNYSSGNLGQVGIERDDIINQPPNFSFVDGTYFQHLTYGNGKFVWGPWTMATPASQQGGMISTFFAVGASGSPDPTTAVVTFSHT